jgi:integrase
MIEEAEEDERNYRRIINLPIHSLEGCVKDYLLDSVEKRSKHRYDGIRYNMGRWIIPFFGAMTNINTITSERIDQFIELHRKRGVKNITIWHYVKDLNALFTWAIRKRRMVENPVMHAENRELIRNRKSVKPPLNMMAINKGIEAITGRDRLYADTLRFMGLRKDEANHVRARDVFDYESEMWLQIVYHHSDIKANRVVPVPPLLWASYREQIDAAKPDDYLFGSRRGKPIYDRRKLFDKIIAAAGVKVMPKDLRDYFTSICQDPVVAQQMLGHTTLNTTAIYTRQVRERMQKGVENLGANSWGKLDS